MFLFILFLHILRRVSLLIPIVPRGIPISWGNFVLGTRERIIPWGIFKWLRTLIWTKTVKKNFSEILPHVFYHFTLLQIIWILLKNVLENHRNTEKFLAHLLAGLEGYFFFSLFQKHILCLSFYWENQRNIVIWSNHDHRLQALVPKLTLQPFEYHSDCCIGKILALETITVYLTTFELLVG